MLKNLFIVCQKWKNADIICYKLVQLVLCNKKMSENKKIKNMMKIHEKSKYWQRNFAYLLNDLRNYNEALRKNGTYHNINIKSHKKPGFHPLYWRCIFRKTIGRGTKFTTLSSHFRVNAYKKSPSKQKCLLRLVFQ